MKTFFVEESSKHNFFNKILKGTIYYTDNKIVINTDIRMLNINKKIKLVKKIKRFLNLQNARQIVLEKSLKIEEFENLFYSENINICNKKWLFKEIIDKIINKILEDENKKPKDCEISICINEIDDLKEEYIYKFAKEFRVINIITNHIGKFRKIERNLYENEGILLNLTNNKRKSLKNAEIILNVDFPKELINQYIIYDKSTIVDLEGNIRIRNKHFRGRIINDYEIEYEEKSDIAIFVQKYHLQNFDIRDICMALQKVLLGNIKYKILI